MSIPPIEVVEALLTHLGVVTYAGQPSPIQLGTAPTGSPNVYRVLELAPGVLHDEGDQADRERHLSLSFRIRTVCRNADVAAATRVAIDLAHLSEARLLDRSVEIEGTAWIVRDREQVATSGPLTEPPFVNVVDDYTIWAVPKTPA